MLVTPADSLIGPDSPAKLAMCKALHKTPFGICTCLNDACQHSLEGMLAIKRKDPKAKLAAFANERSRSCHSLLCPHMKEDAVPVAEMVRSRSSSNSSHEGNMDGKWGREGTALWSVPIVCACMKLCIVCMQCSCFDFCILFSFLDRYTNVW